MTKWIKLTLINDVPIFISIDKIIAIFIERHYFYGGSDKDFTRVEAVSGDANGSIYMVKESVDVVLSKIQDAQGEALNTRYGPTFYTLGAQN